MNSEKELKNKKSQYFQQAKIIDGEEKMNDKDRYIKEIEDEIKALINRDVFIRRGRNNRIYYKFIKREIFQDYSDSDRDDPH